MQLEDYIFLFFQTYTTFPFNLLFLDKIRSSPHVPCWRIFEQYAICSQHVLTRRDEREKQEQLIKSAEERGGGGGGCVFLFLKFFQKCSRKSFFKIRK
jgi:hypothetical protein